jgi:hypothetical protein
MEYTTDKINTPDPASLPDTEKRRAHIGKEFSSKLQFEEAVQRLQEVHEKHTRPATGTFY